MNRYGVTGQATLAATKTILSLISSTARRAHIYDAWASSISTPADAAIRMRLRRFTADGTGTAVTSQALDPADGAAQTTAKENYTAEPTFTANSELFDQSFNQRATLRWVAVPGGEIVTNTTSGNGVGFETVSASTGTPSIETTLHFFE